MTGTVYPVVDEGEVLPPSHRPGHRLVTARTTTGNGSRRRRRRSEGGLQELEHCCNKRALWPNGR